MTRRRLLHAFFRAMRRYFATGSPSRYALAARLADRLADRDRLTLFGGAAR